MRLKVSVPAPTYDLLDLSREQLDTIISALDVAVRVYNLPTIKTPAVLRGHFSMSKKQHALDLQTCLRSYKPQN